MRAASKSSWRWLSFARPSSESSKDEFEVLESSEQSLRAVKSSVDLSAVDDEGSDMEVVTTGLTVMSAAFAVASAEYRPFWYVCGDCAPGEIPCLVGLGHLYCGGCNSASFH